jgi:hypothetical protein
MEQGGAAPEIIALVATRGEIARSPQGFPALLSNVCTLKRSGRRYRTAVTAAFDPQRTSLHRSKLPVPLIRSTSSARLKKKWWHDHACVGNQTCRFGSMADYSIWLASGGCCYRFDLSGKPLEVLKELTSSDGYLRTLWLCCRV